MSGLVAVRPHGPPTGHHVSSMLPARVLIALIARHRVHRISRHGPMARTLCLIPLMRPATAASRSRAQPSRLESERDQFTGNSYSLKHGLSSISHRRPSRMRCTSGAARRPAFERGSSAQPSSAYRARGCPVSPPLSLICSPRRATSMPRQRRVAPAPTHTPSPLSEGGRMWGAASCRELVTPDGRVGFSNVLISVKSVSAECQSETVRQTERDPALR